MFFVEFLLIDIKHDIISNCSKVTFHCLVLVFNVVDKYFKKSHAKFDKLYIDRQKNKRIRKGIVFRETARGHLTTFHNRNFTFQHFLNHRIA